MQQSETVAFLSSGRAFGSGAQVDVVQTHGAFVFLCGDTALKLKRAVRYDYMDLSTVDRRRAMLERELELNRRTAPEIYRDILPVTRDASGITLAGSGEVVDWVLRMWRFPAEAEFEAIAASGGFDDRLALATGAAIAQFHAQAPIVLRPGGALISAILDELGRVFGEFTGVDGTSSLAQWREAARSALDRLRPFLDTRGAQGHVRRGHGDLHLRNLVAIDGRPVLFDALEFDETLGICDTLYDIAFLVMDLCHRALPRQACRVLDAWLREARGTEDAGLRALPLFLSVRAAIRAMVLLQTDAARSVPGDHAQEIAAYLGLAITALRPPPPRLIAVAGLSCSGKSVLARSLAPGLGALPGAVLIASDLERKAGRAASEPLGAESYTPERRGQIYEVMFRRAEALLRAGQSVVLDATFLDPRMRADAHRIATDLAVPFQGFWLTAPETVLTERLRTRKDDASDADRAVLRAQLARDPGEVTWCRLDASGTPEEVYLAASRALGR